MHRAQQDKSEIHSRRRRIRPTIPRSVTPGDQAGPRYPGSPLSPGAFLLEARGAAAPHPVVALARQRRRCRPGRVAAAQRGGSSFIAAASAGSRGGTARRRRSAVTPAPSGRPEHVGHDHLNDAAGFPANADVGRPDRYDDAFSPVVHPDDPVPGRKARIRHDGDCTRIPSQAPAALIAPPFCVAGLEGAREPARLEEQPRDAHARDLPKSTSRSSSSRYASTSSR